MSQNATSPATLTAPAALVAITSFDDFRTYVEKFNGAVLLQNQNYRAELETLNVNKRVATYVNLGEALRMSVVLLAPENREYFVQLLSQRKIPLAKDEQNQFLPVCRVLFGHYNDKGQFVVDPSANAYAPVLRSLDENGVSAANVVQYIESYSSKYGKKLDGIRKQDQHDHGNGIDADAAQAALDLVFSEPAPAELSIAPDTLLGAPAKGKLAAMWGEWNEGQFIPRGFINSTSDQLEKLARKQAVANEPALRRRELTRKDAQITALQALLQAKAPK